MRVLIVPNAKIDSVVGEHAGAIKIKLRAPAIEGKANAALIRFLAEQLKLPRYSIVLERGHRSRDKLIRIDGLTEEDARRRLLENREEIRAQLQVLIVHTHAQIAHVVDERDDEQFYRDTESVAFAKLDD